MNKLTKQKILIAVVAVALVTVIALVANNRQTGTLALTIQLPNASGVVLKLNGKTQKLANTRPNYQLKKGSYQLVISKQNYQDFNANFDISTGRATTVQVAMVRNQPTIPVNSASPAISDVKIAGLSVTNAQYFYDRTWAYIKIMTPDGNSGSEVVKYDDSSASWKTVLGPGTIFYTTDIVNLPADVANYMVQNNLVNQGGASNE